MKYIPIGAFWFTYVGTCVNTHKSVAIPKATNSLPNADSAAKGATIRYPASSAGAVINHCPMMLKATANETGMIEPVTIDAVAEKSGEIKDDVCGVNFKKNVPMNIVRRPPIIPYGMATDMFRSDHPIPASLFCADPPLDMADNANVDKIRIAKYINDKSESARPKLTVARTANNR